MCFNNNKVRLLPYVNLCFLFCQWRCVVTCAMLSKLYFTNVPESMKIKEEVERKSRLVFRDKSIDNYCYCIFLQIVSFVNVFSVSFYITLEVYNQVENIHFYYLVFILLYCLLNMSTSLMSINWIGYWKAIFWSIFMFENGINCWLCL